MESRQLTLDEITSAGIDITDPANRHVFSFDVTLVFEGIPLPPMNIIASGGGGIWGGSGWAGGGWAWRGGGSGGTVYPRAIPTRDDEPPILVFLNIHGHGHFLKSFFEVTLLQYNQAESRFPLENNTATISLPGGLSLAPVFGGQRYTNDMKDIQGGESASASWIIRADAAGVHTIVTEFKGHLMPFGEALTAEFNTTVTVNDSEGLTLIITPQDYAYEGEPYQIDFRLVNNSGAIINALTFDFGGTLIEADTLAPGEYINGTHERIFAAGLGRDDLYFRLIQMIVNARGINIILNWNAPRFGPIGFSNRNQQHIIDTQLIEDHILDPVNIVNGNLVWFYTDFELHGAQNLSFRRYYNSLCDGTTAAGRGWRHSLDYRLVLGSGGARVTVPNGREYIFNESNDGTFTLAGTTQPDVTLTHTPNGYVFVLFDNTHITFNASGRTIEISDVRGNATTLTYDGTLLIRAENRAGVMHFEYENGFITEVRDDFGRSVLYEYDENNRPVIFTNADGYTLEFTYDREGNLTEVRNFNGDIYMRNRFISGQVVEQYLPDQGTSFLSYNPIARTTTWTNAVGEVFIFHYDNNYQITSVEERFGGMQQVFDGGHLISSTCQLGYTTHYEYDNNGNVILVTYPDGTQESFEYNSLRLPVRITHRDGVIETFIYDTRGNLTSWTDRGGNTRTFEYDSENNLILLRNANGDTTAFTHDSSGNVTSVTDAEGNVTTFEYDDLGRRILERLPNGEVTRFTYTAAGRLLFITDAAGNRTYFETDGNGFVTSMTGPEGNTSVMSFDRQNQPVSVTDHEGNRLTRRFDASGRLTHVTDPEGNVTQFDYDGLGRMIRTTDPRRNVWNYAHDASGQLTRITDPYNNEVNLVYDAMGRVVSITNARGAVTSFTHDIMGRVEAVTDAEGGITRTAYDANGNILTMTDALNSTWTFVYDNENRLISTTDPEDTETTFIYDSRGNLVQTTRDGAAHTNAFDANGRLTSTTDPEGNITSFEYDALGRLTEIENADGTTVSFEYNDSGHLTRTTDEAGNQTSYITDRNGRVLSVTDAMNNTTRFTYDRNGRILTETDALGGVTRFAYDRNGNLTTITDALGNATTMTYDRLNRVATITDALGNVTRFAYDENGNVTTITDAEGYTVNFAYDLLDRLTQTTNQAGGIFRNTFDAVGNLTLQTDALGNETAFEYDLNHRLTRVTDPLLNFVTFYYDSHDRIIRIIDQEGAITNYTHDDNGRVTAITDALNNTTTIEYDAMGRVRRTTDPRGAVTNFTYTPTGLLQTVTDAHNNTITFAYNALGQLIRETNQNGDETTFTRDALGRITAVTNALNHTETFTYDSLGRITAVTDRNGRTTTYQHDANGNIIEVTDPTGNISIFEYDRLNRLISADVNGGQITLYQYDGRGLLTREVNTLGDARIFVYDANGNLISQTDEDGYVTTFNYNVLNLVERINHSDGRQASFYYDAAGRLTQVTDWTGTTDFTLDLLGRITEVNDHNNRTVTYAYDANGNQTHVTYPDSTAVTRVFDQLNRLTNIQTPEGNFTYTRDATGRVTSLAYPNGITETYTHDAIGQLLTIRQGSEVLNQYTYDPVGNIISRTGAEHDIIGSVTSNTFNDFNQLTAQTVYNLRGEVTGMFEFTYDNRGNLTQELDVINNTAQTYTFDARNRMVRGVNHHGEESIYVYNALNILTRRETVTAAENSSSSFVTDYTSFVPINLMEYQSNGITQRHIYGNGLTRISTTLSTASQTATFFIQNDRLGSTRFATDATGARVAETLLDEWGNILQHTTLTFAGSEVNILNMYTNHQFDPILGLYYMQARFYCPSNRRFISADPFWGAHNRIYGDNPHNLVPCIYSIRQAGNLHSYVLNNPLRFTDSTGLVLVDLLDYAATYSDANVSILLNPMYIQRSKINNPNEVVARITRRGVTLEITAADVGVYGRTTGALLWQNEEFRFVVSDSLFVDAFGVGTDTISVYECATTGNVSIRGAFHIFECPDNPLGGDVTRYSDLFLEGVEYWWTGRFGRYNVATHARFSENGIPVAVRGGHERSFVDWGAGSFRANSPSQWSREDPGRAVMYRGRLDANRSPVNPFSEADFMWTAAHEFGHLLGLYGPANQGYNFGGAIMGVRNTRPTAEIIRMVIRAYNRNSPQRSSAAIPRGSEN
jgi:RHS repeat-associated protein